MARRSNQSILKGDQSRVLIGRTDAKAETPIFWPSDVKSWLIWKDPDAGKDWRWRRRVWQRMRWLDGITNSRSSLRLTSIESVMPSNHLILCRPLLLHLQSFPASESFPMSRCFTSGDQSLGTSALSSVLPMNIQDWFPLGLMGLISLLSRGLSRVFCVCA